MDKTADHLTHTLESHVARHALTQPQRVAIVCQGLPTTYSELWQATLATQEQLRSEGAAQGKPHFFRATPDVDFFRHYMAAHLLGAAAAPLGKHLPEAAANHIRQLYGSETMPHSDHPTERIADILFTTGSTGKQKGVMLSQRALMANAENLISAQGFTAETVFIICGPLDHIGSLSKIWPVLIEGGTLIVLDGMKDMTAFFDAFSYPSRKLATFMVPASIRLMLQLGEKKLARLADKIDFIETGGAAITLSDMEQLCKALPKTRLYNTYASTETGIIATYDYNHQPCVAGCCGKAMHNSAFAITPDGTIACSGQTLMSGYLGETELTRTVMRNGTVLTNDLGEIDAQGMLHITGRNSDIINIGGFKVSPLEVESAALTHPAVADCVCCAAHSDIFGQTIKLVYTTASGCEISKKTLAQHLAQRIEAYKIPRLFEPSESIRHLFNGKLDRAYYNSAPPTAAEKA